MTGYKVDAIDGEIGKVDAATNDVGQSYLIVNTGPWIFGKKVMLPAGVVKERRPPGEAGLRRAHEGPDPERARVHRLDADDNNYRHSLGTYYGEGGAGWYEPAADPAPPPGPRQRCRGLFHVRDARQPVCDTMGRTIR